jgi:3'-phosphoadenosine 5'-phosphosulfate sulfotransferase (PAPS reductase)/FAD synthetase
LERDVVHRVRVLGDDNERIEAREGDMPITGAVESVADDLTKIIEEIATTRTTERGGRADDKRAETAMEDRKKQGYF